MALAPTKLGSEIWRGFEVDGVPASGEHRPIKADIREWTEYIEARSRRETLIANRTYYVRTDGSDSNDGLSNTAGGAFLTLQQAANVVFQTLDIGAYNVTISVAAGTYAAGVLVSGTLTGTGLVTFDCPSGTAIISAATGFDARDGAAIRVTGGFKFTGSTFGITASEGGSRIEVSGIELAGPVIGIYASRQSYVEIIGDIYVSVGGTYLIEASHQGNVRMSVGTITFLASVTYTQQTIYVSSGGDITLTGSAAISIGAFTVTGRRFKAESNGVLQWAGAAITAFPGTTPGVETTGGKFFRGGTHSDRIKGSTVHDMASATGTVVIDLGANGFSPGLISIRARLQSPAGNFAHSIGEATFDLAAGISQDVLYIDYTGQAAGDALGVAWIIKSAGAHQKYALSAVGNTSFTLTNTKTGAPTGNVVLEWTAHRMS